MTCTREARGWKAVARKATPRALDHCRCRQWDCMTKKTTASRTAALDLIRVALESQAGMMAEAFIDSSCVFFDWKCHTPTNLVASMLGLGWWAASCGSSQGQLIHSCSGCINSVCSLYIGLVAWLHKRRVIMFEIILSSKACGGIVMVTPQAIGSVDEGADIDKAPNHLPTPCGCGKPLTW
eukprot:5408424-Amphidinium_carterae.1